MNIPLVMNAAPIDSINNQIKSNEAEFISKNSILPNNTSNTSNTKKETNVNTLKSLIQNIHNNTDNNEEGDLYNSLSNYESATQKSFKPNYKIDNNLINSSNTQLAYTRETNNNNNNTTNNLNIENKEELLQKLNYIIYTLDKQKDIKSDQKIEELLLYSFLGMFIIYVLDSFTKIGKYKR